MKKGDIAERMQKLLASLPEPGEASGGQRYEITMFKMSLLLFITNERLNKLTCTLTALTAVLAVLTIVLIVLAVQ